MDERVGIDYLKRYAADIELKTPGRPSSPKTNGKAAVVGGGPAGLTAAYFLTLKGTRRPSSRWRRSWAACSAMASPNTGFPKALLDREIKWITDLGVEVKTENDAG